MRYKPFLIAFALIAAILAGGWACLKFLPASLGYTVEAEFADFPPDDTALEEWLRRQPGVVKAFVGQREGEPGVLVIDVLMVRNGWGDPPFPDLETKCDELGYHGRAGRFRDSKREGGISISPRPTNQRPAPGGS